jgi:diguanylate cyclase (GGDEF)-like protein
MKVHVAGAPLLARTLVSRRKLVDTGREVDLREMLGEVLSWAGSFVPSKSGSILLNDPTGKEGARGRGRLYFAACYGRNSASLVGKHLLETEGIAGETFGSGKPYISVDVSKDKKFLGEIDKKINYHSESIICVPIDIKGTIIGVIELINRIGRKSFSGEDLAMLEIFAGYTAAFIENSLLAREFEELSRIDDLTKLYNDRHFFRRLEGEVRVASRDGTDVSLIFFDLDRFKEVNDTYGHLAGSEVLKEVAAILRKILGKTDSVTARYGGDEYVVIMPGTGITEAARHAEAIREGIAANTFLKKKGARGVPALKIKNLITCSIGVASFSRNVLPRENPSEMADALIRSADRAMYRSKEGGKNTFVLSEDKRI